MGEAKAGIIANPGFLTMVDEKKRVPGVDELEQSEKLDHGSEPELGWEAIFSQEKA